MFTNMNFKRVLSALILMAFAGMPFITFEGAAWADDELPPEAVSFGFGSQTPPDPEDSGYIIRDEAFSENSESFNNVYRKTRTISISGKTLVFEEGHANHLYDYHNNDGIKEMNLYADTVIIRSPLHLPQTNVTIYARELRFEDDGSVSTVPRSEASRASQYGNGGHGLKAGDITLYIKSFICSEGYRFFLNGGNGQPAGLGNDGNPGSKMNSETRGGYSNVVYEDYDRQENCLWCIGCRWHDEEWGIKAWPGDGTNARAGGKPGNGGKGGNFSSSVEIEDSYMHQAGGNAGGKAPDYKGGDAGPPVNAKWVYHKRKCKNKHSYSVSAEHTSKPGADAPAPSANIPTGQKGTNSLIGNSMYWLHPAVLKQIMAYTKDLYLSGDLDKVELIFDEYISLLGDYMESDEWDVLPEEEQLDLTQMYAEMRILQHQIASRLDYFGNPAGWVPMLSFEVNKTAFDNEIDHAIRVLYLSYWILNSASGIEDKVAALQLAQEETEAETLAFEQEYDAVTNLIPDLQEKSEEIATRVTELQNELQALERDLIEKAEGNVEDAHKKDRWRKVAKIAGGICTVCPVGQPVVGAIGVGLTIVSNFDKDEPWETIKELPKIAEAYNSSEFEKKAGDWKNARKNCKTAWQNMKDADNKWLARKEYLEKLGDMGQLFDPIGKELEGIKGVLHQSEGPEAEVNAELEKLKAESPEFTELINEIRKLMGQKKVFAQELATSIQKVTTLSNSITNNMLAMDGFNHGITEGNAVLDARAIMYLEDMEQRAKERLLKYHYYMAKAYEYRMLEPYTGKLDLSGLFDKFKVIAEAGSGESLSSTDFDSLKALYEEQLSTITASIFDTYNSNSPELSAPVYFELDKETLEKVNAGDPAVINMMEMGLFHPSEENVRIVDLEVDSMDLLIGDEHLTVSRAHKYLNLYMEHSGISKLTKDGETYLFRHYKQSGQNPLVWGARYDRYGDIITPIRPSAASESLLRSLLDSPSNEDLLIYSRPAGWADINIRKDVNTSDSSDMVIERLVLKLTYDFMRKDNMSILEVMVPEGSIRPRFTVIPEDRNGRKDGIVPYFRRAYSTGSSVTVTAPSVCDEWEFEKWTDRNGISVLSTNPSLSLDLGDNQAVQAHYTLPGLMMTVALASFSPANLAVFYTDEHPDGKRDDVVGIKECGNDGCGIPGASFDIDDDGNQTVALPVRHGAYYFVLHGTEEGDCDLTTALKFGNGVISSEELETEIKKGQILKSDVTVTYQNVIPEYLKAHEDGYDFDANGCIDTSDIMKVASRWDDDEVYDVFYDFDGNGRISVADIMRVASQFDDCD